jgi:hypothetical protein
MEAEPGRRSRLRQAQLEKLGIHELFEQALGPRRPPRRRTPPPGAARGAGTARPPRAATPH